MNVPNLGLSSSTSSGASAGLGDFIVTGGGSAAKAFGPAASAAPSVSRVPWYVWAGAGVLALAGLFLFFRRRR